MKTISTLYVTGTLVLISFLSFSSQLQFYYFEPGPLSRRDAVIFNFLIASLFISYFRACRTDPGRIPGDQSSEKQLAKTNATRWCRKCNGSKPPRAHHCKQCNRCIMKMDHHCPWTVNCVSFRTFPHFFRFLFYAVSAMGMLEYFLFHRLSLLWEKRNWPSSMGPTALQLAHIFLLVLVNSFTLFALVLLLCKTAWGLAANITTIEGWEIERHHSLLRRARANGGILIGPGGVEVKLVRHEFPYDIGIWSNICQGMGTGNFAAWLWPLAATPKSEKGLNFKTNDFNEDGLTWPPPDPDRVPVLRRVIQPTEDELPNFESTEGKQAFRSRLAQDRSRWVPNGSGMRQRAGFVEEDEVDSDELSDGDEVQEIPSSADPLHRKSWRNAEGERLGDFGVDEEVDDYDETDEDDVPLSELIARKQAIRRKT